MTQKKSTPEDLISRWEASCYQPPSRTERRSLESRSEEPGTGRQEFGITFLLRKVGGSDRVDGLGLRRLLGGTLCFVCLLAATTLLRAADTDSDPVIVPLQDSSRPPTIHAHVMSGGIRVRGEDRKDIAVENHGHSHDSRSPRADGMHRIDSGEAGFDITEDQNVVTVKTDVMHMGGDLVMVVPRHSSLELKSLAGGQIDVEGVDGEIEVENLNGSIHLKDVSGSVVAHSMNGEVTADLKRVDPAKPMSFSTMNGKIDVSLPADVKADVTMKTDNGEILSDFDIRLDSSAKPTDADNSRHSDGSYHIHMDRTLRGTINGGGPELKFRSFNGQILIRKRK